MQDYVEAVFFSWLSSFATEDKAEKLKPYLFDIEKRANRTGIIRGGLFVNLTVPVAQKIQHLYATDREERTRHKRQYKNIDEAINYLIAFSSDIEGIVPEKVIAAKPQTTDELPLSEQYALEPSSYSSIEIADCHFSVRVEKRLLSIGVHNVGNLLCQSDSSLRSISGFGNNCLIEVHKYLQQLASNSKDTLDSTLSVTPSIQLTSELEAFRDQLYAGNFSFTSTHKFSKKSYDIIEHYKTAYETLDPKLISLIKQKAPGAMDIYGMLHDFVSDSTVKEAIQAVLLRIPGKRLQLDAGMVIKCFSNNVETLQFFSEKLIRGQTLEQFIRANINDRDEPVMSKFLKWCTFDVNSDINGIFEKVFVKERVKYVFQSRIRGETLNTLGETIGITRERIRQIEAKALRQLRESFLRQRIGQKLFMDIGIDGILKEQNIFQYVSEYGLESIAVLKECCGKEYNYDTVINAFRLGPLVNYSEIVAFFDNLPDYIVADELEHQLKQSNLKEKFPEAAIQFYLDEGFKRTGDVYHRTRMSLTGIYSETLRKYYPDGIHIDDDEIDRFKELVENDFHIDISEKNNRAVGTIITRVGILCNRGTYKPRDSRDQITPRLANRIARFIEHNPVPIMTMRAIYDEFEEQLKKQGIDNRYYMFGILKDLFSDKWYFNKDYVSRDKSIGSLYGAIVDFISASKSPVSKEELFQHFPGLNIVGITQATNDTDILNLFGEYINVSRLTITDEDIMYFRRKIEEALAENEICYVRDLYSEMHIERPGLLSRNYITTGFKLFSVLEYFFAEDFNFSRPFIAREGAEIKSIVDVLKEMVRESEVIAIDDIRDFASDHNYGIYNISDFCASCNDSHLMINSEELASIDYIGMTEMIAYEVENLILQEISAITPISHLYCVSHFPKINVEWNAWLIYSVLRKWSTKLSVTATKLPLKVGYPLVAPAGSSMEFEYDQTVPRGGKLFIADDLGQIDDLLDDFELDDNFDDMEDLDEF